MEKNEFYESPAMEAMELESENFFCSSPVTDEDGEW